jgi:hypothetical protein
MSTIPQYIPFGAIGQSFSFPPGQKLINFSVNVPSSGGTGQVNLAVPDHTAQFATMGIQLARMAAYMVSIAEAIQLISNEKGGIRIKDALDPYQFELITKALEANELPVPPSPPEADVKRNPTGGEILAQAGNLIGAAATAASVIGFANDAIGTAADKFWQGSSAGGVFSFTSPIGFPDITPGIAVMSGSIDIINIALSNIAKNLNEAVDVPSKSLLLKTVLSDFQVALNEQATEIAQREIPEKPNI